MTDAPGPQPVHRTAASLLRHDLVNPINQILGYADLLADDADRQGWAPEAESLRSIQELTRRALGSIDEVLIREPELDPSRPPDLQALADEVVSISEAIGQACRALENASTQVTDRAGFLDDVGRIRDAAALLSRMVRQASVAEAEGS